MAQKSIDLNADSKEETIDLTLRLSLDKGKAPIEGPSQVNKRKRDQKESGEDTSTGRSHEDRFARLEHRLRRLEKRVNQNTLDLASRLDTHFTNASYFLHAHQAQSLESLRAIHSVLQQINAALRSKSVPFNIPSSSTPSPSPKPPRP